MSSVSGLGAASGASQMSYLRSILSQIGLTEKAEENSEEQASSTQSGSGFFGFPGSLSSFSMQEIASMQAKPSSSDMFSSMDTDDDGVLLESEFVAGRPGGVSEEEAATLYAELDTEGTGITEEQFAAFEESKGTRTISAEGAQGADRTASAGGASSASAEEEFDELDTNEDGVVSRSEYLAGHPELDVEAEVGSSSSSSSTETQQTMLTKLMEAIKAYKSAGYDLNQTMFEQMVKVA